MSTTSGRLDVKMRPIRGCLRPLTLVGQCHLTSTSGCPILTCPVWLAGLPAMPASSRPLRRFAAISLFSGCGGLDLGAQQTGEVEVVWANDLTVGVRDLQAEYRPHIVEGDICELAVPEIDCDLLLAGPPCQDFSTLWNHDGARTARGNLFREVARFLAALQPAGFVLENVPGLLSANRGAAWTIVRHALRAPGAFLYYAWGRVTT